MNSTVPAAADSHSDSSSLLRLSSSHFSGSVSGLAFLSSSHLISCCGSDLYLYHIQFDSIQLINKFTCFMNGQRIQGFQLYYNYTNNINNINNINNMNNINNNQSTSNPLIICWSGREISIIELNRESLKFYQQLSIQNLSDQIWTVKPLKINNNNNNESIINQFHLAVGLAHNSVSVYTIRLLNSTGDSYSHSYSYSLFHHSNCSERSLIYSIAFIGSCIEELEILAGTVFSVILTWKFHLHSSISPVRQRLFGHDGVIFHISTILNNKNEFCSVSDDRTVRHWSRASSNDSVDSAVWSAGFSSFGHESRVWRSLMKTDNFPILSCGEDGTVRAWNRSNGKQLGKIGGFKGGVWSIAVDENLEFFAAGAGDGAIKIMRMEQLIGNSSNNNESSTFNDEEENKIISDDKLSTVAESSKLINSESSNLLSIINISTLANSSVNQLISSSSSSSSSADTCDATINSNSPVSAPTAFVVEYCRQLTSIGPENYYFITNFGRIIHLNIPINQNQSANENKNIQYSSRLIATAEVLPPSSSLSVEFNGRFIAIGDQRGGIKLFSTESNDSFIIPNDFKTACLFLQFSPSISSSSSLSNSSTTANGFPLLIAGDATGEIRMWEIDFNKKLSNLLLSFRLPVKAKLSAALIIKSLSVSSNTNNNACNYNNNTYNNNDTVIDNNNRFQPEFLFICGDLKGSIYCFTIFHLNNNNNSNSNSNSNTNINNSNNNPLLPRYISIPNSRLSFVHDSNCVSALYYNSNRIYSVGQNSIIAEIELELMNLYDTGIMKSPEQITNKFWIEKHIEEQIKRMELNTNTTTNNNNNQNNQFNINDYLSDTSQFHRLYLVRQQKIPFAQCIGLEFPNQYHPSSILCFGLDYQDFLVFDCSSGSPITRFPCGGGKRPIVFDSRRIVFARQPEKSSTAGSSGNNNSSVSIDGIASVDSGELIVVSQPIRRRFASPLVFGSRFHSRLSTSCVGFIGRDGTEYLLSASEDKLIRSYKIGKLEQFNNYNNTRNNNNNNNNNNQNNNNNSTLHRPFQPIISLSDHPDVIRALALVENNSNYNNSNNNDNNNNPNSTPLEYTLFSAGGRDYLHATRIRLFHNHDGNNSSTELLPEFASLSGIGGKIFKTTGKVWMKLESDEKEDKIDLRILGATAFKIPIMNEFSTSSSSSNSSSVSLSLIALGDSSGNLRFYFFDHHTNRYYFLYSSVLHASPILAVKHLIIQNNSGDNINSNNNNNNINNSDNNNNTQSFSYLIISGSTNGKLAIWNITELITESIIQFRSGLLSAVKESRPANPTLIIPNAGKRKKIEKSPISSTSPVVPATATSEETEKMIVENPIATNPEESISSSSSLASNLMKFQLKPIFIDRIHQSGINCITTAQIPHSSNPHQHHHYRYFIFSGGDDQSISGIEYSPHTTTTTTDNINTNIPLFHRFSHIPNAHYSAIKTMKFDYNTNCLYSSGYDQRLKIWNLIIENHIENNLLSTTGTKLIEFNESEIILPLSDVASMEIINDNIILTGQGMCAIQIHKSNWEIK